MKEAIGPEKHNIPQTKMDDDPKLAPGIQPELNAYRGNESIHIRNSQRHFGNMATLRFVQEAMEAGPKSEAGKNGLDEESDQAGENGLYSRDKQPRLTPTVLRIQRTQTSDSTAPANNPEPANQADPETGSIRPALIVEDTVTDLQPGQMHKSVFLSELRSSVYAAAETALAGTMFSAIGSPWIERWFNHYQTLNAQQLEAAVQRFTPSAAGINSGRDYIPLITGRIRQTIENWNRTGQITGLPEGLFAVPFESSGFLGGLANSDSSVLRGAGQVIRGIGSVLFKTREGQNPNQSTDPRQIQNRLGPGRSLDSGVKFRMGSYFGRDFSHVRIHTDTRASRLSRDLNARAFTIGRDIGFGAGEYRPGTMIGDALIAHEMAHVVQQQGSNSNGTFDSGDNRNLEDEADLSAVNAMGQSYGGFFGRMRNLTGTIIPKVRSGLKLQRCSQETETINPLRNFNSMPLMQMVWGENTINEINLYLGTLSTDERALAIRYLQTKRVDYERAQSQSPSTRNERHLRRVDLILQGQYLILAQSESDDELLVENRTLSTEQQINAQNALTPQQEGNQDVFVERPPHRERYQTRLIPVILNIINEWYEESNDIRRSRQDGNQTNLYSWDEVISIGNRARQEVIQVFGGYVSSPPILSRGRFNSRGEPEIARNNIFDNWEAEQARQSQYSEIDRKNAAKQNVIYIINNHPEIRGVILPQHYFSNEAVNNNPDLTRGDRDTLNQKIADTIVKDPGMINKLLLIERTYPGGADTNTDSIYIQRLRGSRDTGIAERFQGENDQNQTNTENDIIRLADRYGLWNMFQIVIEEYIHILNHDEYIGRASERYGHGSGEWNTLIEGVTSLMTEIVWRNIEPRVNDRNLRCGVEGPEFCNQDPPPSTFIPDITGRRYPSYSQVMELVNTVGIRNLYSAYFLGRTNLIGL